MRTETRPGSESHVLMVVWISFMDISLTSHFDLPDSESIWCICDPPMLTWASQPRWIVVKRPVGSWHHLLQEDALLPSDLQGAFTYLCSQRGLLDFEKEEYVFLSSYLGRAQPLHPSAFMEFLGTEERTVQLGAHLAPAQGCFHARFLSPLPPAS